MEAKNKIVTVNFLFCVICLGFVWLTIREFKAVKTNTELETLNHSEIPTIDSTYCSLQLNLRRMESIMHTNEVDRQYYVNASLYYKTHIDKYRLRANVLHYDYIVCFRLYQAREDSLNKGTIY